MKAAAEKWILLVVVLRLPFAESCYWKKIQVKSSSAESVGSNIGGVDGWRKRQRWWWERSSWLTKGKIPIGLCTTERTRNFVFVLLSNKNPDSSPRTPLEILYDESSSRSANVTSEEDTLQGNGRLLVPELIHFLQKIAVKLFAGWEERCTRSAFLTGGRRITLTYNR